MKIQYKNTVIRSIKHFCKSRRYKDQEQMKNILKYNPHINFYRDYMKQKKLTNQKITI